MSKISSPGTVSDSKRSVALPAPHEAQGLASFTPDSSVVSDVIPSPNHGVRNKGLTPDMILLHYTGMPDVEGAITRLCTLGTDVSAHYIVLEDGRIVQSVPESRRAWHAGLSYWAGEDDINSCSIGIEISNRGHDWGYPNFPPRQIAAVTALCRGIMLRHELPFYRVLGHSDVAPGRKQDPGEKFPWQSLANSGVGMWVRPCPIVNGQTIQVGSQGDAVRALQDRLAQLGYGVTVNGVFDTQTAEVVSAFQRHFRPERVDGIGDISTIKTLRDLIASLPEDALCKPTSDPYHQAET